MTHSRYPGLFNMHTEVSHSFTDLQEIVKHEDVMMPQRDCI